MTSRFALPLLVTIVWISGWFPSDFKWWHALIAAVAVLLQALALWLSRSERGGRLLMRRACLALAVLALISGLCFAFAARAVGTPVDGGLALFHTIGWSAYFYWIASLSRPSKSAIESIGRGGGVLLALAAWSWMSALSMHSHRGAVGNTGNACILVSVSPIDERPLSSFWRMRLPEVASSVTGPTGSTILYYHAVLVVPDGTPSLYNWSKKRMRFEPLDRTRNPYLPEECP